MKNIFKKIFFSVLVTCLFISCSDFSNSDSSFVTNEKGRIIISTNLDSQSRSVLPTGITEQTQGLTWELVGTCEEKTYSERWNDTTSEDGSVTSTAYNNMKNDNDLLLDVGIWLFSLKVKNNNGYVLVGTTQVAINSGENTLSFVMNEATSDDLSDGETVASGSIEFTLNFPKDVVDKVVAKLFKYENNNTEISNQTLSIDSSSTDNCSFVKYSYPDATGTTSSPLSAGYYILKIQLQQSVNNQNMPINTYSCLIRVAPGLLSQGKYTLPDLAQLYTINYKLEGGYFTDSSTTTSYNAYTSFELPEPTLDGHYFAGWYTQEYADDGILIDEKFFGNAGDTKTISEDITLYAKYVKAYEFNLYDSTGKPVSDGYKVENGIGSVTLDNTGNSVWDYYLKSTDIFNYNYNYKITVEMKAEADSVVAIQAANADMFFTVGTEWTTCTMETGFIEKPLDSSRNGISFGLGLSQKTYFKNLVIEPISSDDGLPTLVFDITTEGINQYLKTTDKADKIIEVKKVVDASGMATGYAITINAPLSHNDENNVVQQDVKLHLRDYAKSVGVNNVSFEVTNTGSNPFATSFMADTASNNSMAWNNVRTEVVNNNSCNIDFPNYTANDELTVDVITGSDNVYSYHPVEFTISDFKVENASATAGPFSGKIFAIKTGDTWTQGNSVEVTIPASDNKEFDVGMFNGWDSSKNMPSSFDDVTRFLYTGDANITDNLSYSVDEDNPSDPKFTIKNTYNSPVNVKITLNENYTVSIKEVDSATTVSGITHADNTLYISSYEGLCVFRNIVNGTLESDITIPANADHSGENVNYSKDNSVTNCNVVLERDITINEDWTPIGVYTNDSSQVPYVGEFNGNNKTIIFGDSVKVNSQAAGLFGAISTSCNIYNLIIDGNIQSSSTSTAYVGGIVGYATGGSVQNCVNRAKIQGTWAGGIAGKTQSTSFMGCVNFGEITGTSYSAGIVGAAASNTSINLCVNIGKLTSSATACGISGDAPSDIIVQNCINLGTLSATNNIYGIASGSGTISCNISAGKFEGTVQFICYAVSSSATGTNYYDNSIYSSFSQVTNVEGKATSEFSNCNPDELAWSAAEGRYPLPNISENVDAGIQAIPDEIWNEIYNAAAISVSDPIVEKAYYVSADGSDSNDGLSVDNAFKTLDKAITSANSSDSKTVYVIGTYAGEEASYSATYISSDVGSEGNPVVICGYPDSNPTLSQPSGSGRRVMYIYPDTKAYITLKNLTITGGNASQYGAGIYVTKTNLTIDNCIISNNTSTSTFTFKGQTITSNGIEISSNSNVNIVNSNISDNIKISDSSSSPSILSIGEGCNISENIYITSDASSIEIGDSAELTGSICVAGSSSGTNIPSPAIKIKSSLSNYSDSNQITIIYEDYEYALSQNKQVIALSDDSSGVTLSDEIAKFKLDDSNYVINSEGYIKSFGGGSITYSRGDLYLDSISVNNNQFEKTGMVVVAPNTVTITGSSENWNKITGESYSSSTMKGVFYANRNVTLSPYAIGKYEVTQELYESVMDANPSTEKGETRPVETLSWFDIILFCNNLTEKTLGIQNCVYYTDESFTTPYNDTSIETVYIDISKCGYRLPTEAEWEFAARGGDTSADEWFYAFAGTNSYNDNPLYDTSKKGSTNTYYEYDTSGYLITDANLDYYAVYSGNSSGITNVGTKTSNTLGLYDMSGNVYEFVNDNLNTITTGDVTDPITSNNTSSRVIRGGAYDSYYGAYACCVTYRKSLSNTSDDTGFRLCRSIVQ